MTFFTADSQVRSWVSEAEDVTTVVPTGYAALDNYLKRGGIRRRYLAGLLARSNVGKTMLACNIVSHATTRGIPTFFSSQEMTEAEVVNRLLACTYGLKVNDIEERQRNGRLHRKWLERYVGEMAYLVIYTKNQPTFDDLSNALRDYEQALGVRPVFVVQDHLQLLSQNGLYGNEAVKVARQAQLLKEFARAEDVAVLSLNQTGRNNESDVNRRNHGHIPLSMEDLMYGGEQHYDIIFGMYRPERDPALWDMTLEGPAQTEAMATRERWRDRAVLQVVKNRFAPLNLEGAIVRADWSEARFYEDEQDRRTMPELVHDAIEREREQVPA